MRYPSLKFLRYTDMPMLRLLAISCSDSLSAEPDVLRGLSPMPTVHSVTLNDIPSLRSLTHILSSTPNTRHLTIGGTWTLETLEVEVKDFLSHLESLTLRPSTAPTTSLSMG